MGWLSARGWLWGAHLDISPELNWDSAPLAFSYRRRREIATCTAQQNCEYLFLFSPRKAYLLKTSKCCVPETSYKMNKYLKCYSNSEIFLARKRGAGGNSKSELSSRAVPACMTHCFLTQPACRFVHKEKQRQKAPTHVMLFTFISALCLIRPDLSPRGEKT